MPAPACCATLGRRYASPMILVNLINMGISPGAVEAPSENLAELLEGVGGAQHRRVLPVPADQHHPDRQPPGHTSRDGDRRVSCHIEGTGVRDHLERTPDVLLAARVGRWKQR